MVYDLLTLFTNLKQSREKLIKKQWQKLKKILQYAYYTSPFYQDLFEKNDIKPDDIKKPADLLKIPYTTKDDLRYNANDLIAFKYRNKNLQKKRSSGSTGEPSTVYFNWVSWLQNSYLLTLRTRRIYGYQFTDKRVVVSTYSPEEIEPKNKELFNRLTGKTFMSVGQDFSTHLKLYRRLKPDIIYATSSYLKELIRYVNRSENPAFKLKFIVTSEEMSDPAETARIEDFFQCPVYDIYGAKEFSEVAWQCKQRQGYHINIDHFYVEFITDVGQPAKENEDGNLIITSLSNKAMPLIRYDIGDKGRYTSAPCPCGNQFPLMKVVLGRYVDYISLPDGRKIAPYTMLNYLRLSAGEFISQYQVIQKQIDSVIIRIRPRSNFTPGIEKNIIHNYKVLFGTGVNIRIEKTKEPIPREKSGKYRLVKSFVT